MVKNFFLNSLLIILCVLPLWVYEEFNNINSSFFTIIIFYLSLFFLPYIYLSNKKKKLKKIERLFFSLIIFYGLDLKIGFWKFLSNLFFEFRFNQIENLFFLYIPSFFIVILITFSINKFIKKNFLEKRNFLIFTFLIFISFNFSKNYYLNFKHQTINEYNSTLKEDYKKKDKLIIIVLDEMIGYGGIDEKINFGKHAKQSYIDLYNKFNFNLYINSYSKYISTRDSLPHALNFDLESIDYIDKKYFQNNLLDHTTKSTLKKNLFFERNNKILTLKNRAINYCNKKTTVCLRNNFISLDKNYFLKNFKYNKLEIFIKKAKSEGSILYQYLWRSLYELNFIHGYINLVFDKVQFENQLSNLPKIIKNSDHDLYFFHFLFPHRPFIFEIDNQKKCLFSKNKTQDIYFTNRTENVEQHYKEIICTNYLVQNFLTNLSKDNFLEEINILITSDTGLKIRGNQKKQQYYVDAHANLFAIKLKDEKFSKISEEVTSSQELFSRYFNSKHFDKNKKLEVIEKKYMNIYDPAVKSFINVNFK